MTDDVKPTEAEVAAARAFIAGHTQDELLAMKRAGREWTPAEKAALFGDASDAYKNRHKAHNDELVRMLDAGEKMCASDRKRAKFVKSERAKGETYL